MQTLNLSETLMVSGGDVTHLLVGGVVGLAVATAGLYFAPLGLAAGTVGGAIIVNTYSSEVDSAYQWGKSFFVSSVPATTATTTAETTTQTA